MKIFCGCKGLLNISGKTCETWFYKTVLAKPLIDSHVTKFFQEQTFAKADQQLTNIPKSFSHKILYFKV